MKEYCKDIDNMHKVVLGARDEKTLRKVADKLKEQGPFFPPIRPPIHPATYHSHSPSPRPSVPLLSHILAPSSFTLARFPPSFPSSDRGQQSPFATLAAHDVNLRQLLLNMWCTADTLTKSVGQA